MKTDWRAAARAFAPEVPLEQLDRIFPVLALLEEAVRPAIEGLPLDLPPATDVEDEP